MESKTHLRFLKIIFIISDRNLLIRVLFLGGFCWFLSADFHEFEITSHFIFLCAT